MGRGECGLEIYLIPDAESAVLLEGDEGLSVMWARTGLYPAGCTTTARTKEDGPVTWEALILPRAKRGRPPARETVAAANEEEGVGGLHTSVEVGEPKAPGPGRAKAARVVVNLEGEPWPALRRWGPCHRNFPR